MKLDGDGQMKPEYIESLIAPSAGQAAYTKGNRFPGLELLQMMPLGRKIGSQSLSFLIKLASGYWNASSTRPTDLPRFRPKRFDNLISRDWKNDIFSKVHAG
jgi:hypothetical protein